MDIEKKSQIKFKPGGIVWLGLVMFDYGLVMFG